MNQSGSLLVIILLHGWKFKGRLFQVIAGFLTKKFSKLSELKWRRLDGIFWSDTDDHKKKAFF